jgi:cyclophilin family peptidyl-prolyl cis-trans isomerase
MMSKPFFFTSLLLLTTSLLLAQKPAFDVVADSLLVYEPIAFANKSSKAVRYEWDFGDGTKDTLASPTHRYFFSGQYTVKLTAFAANNKSRSYEKKIYIKPPTKCLVHMQTPMGYMILHLFDATPAHQDNFVKLAEQHFFDSLLFHRVIQGFMIQGGDPNSRNPEPGKPLGTGGPGYTIKAEFADSLAHVKGALAAARTNNPQKRSSGSQFYIVQGKPVTDEELNRIEAQKNFRYPRSVREAYLSQGGTPFLDQDYSVFGRVVEGLDVIDRIAATRTNAENLPLEKMWMIVRLMR